MRYVILTLWLSISIIGCGDDDSPEGASLVQTSGNDSTADASATDGTDSSDGTSGSDVSNCIEEKCADGWDTCQTNENCASLWNCLSSCEDEACQQSCLADTTDEARQTVERLLDCGAKAGCFGNSGSECGNGACESGENTDNCPADCKDQPSLEDCFNTSCADEVSACYENESCGSALTCVLECGEPNCFQPCAQQAGGGLQSSLGPVRQCANAAGCFDPTGPKCGNGVCEAGETPDNCPQDCESEAGSCAGVCNTFIEAAGCQCDIQCVEFSDCCPDYFELCEENADCGNGVCEPGENTNNCPQDCQSQMFCGDGVCDGPENQTNCPQDCGNDPVDGIIDCVEVACPAEAAACFADDECAELVECAVDCNFDLECAQSCFSGIPSGPIVGVFQCALGSGCLDQFGPVCGDGSCDDGEDQFNCPQDCQPQGFCGDGDCSGPENGFNCPEDCEETPECGNDTCDGGESAGSCPADCDNGGQICGDGYCGANETAVSCAQDCEPRDVCAQESCPDLYYQCIDNPACTGLNTCLGECGTNNTQCEEQCYIGVSGAVQDVFFELIGCAQEFDCFDLNESCGDGQCNNGESETTCPGDCEPPAPTCGDGNCDDSEDFVTCPQDCEPPAPICGDGICAGTESISSCPADCTPIDPEQCITEKCVESFDACKTDLGCLKGLQCLAECDGVLSCTTACKGAISDTGSINLFTAVLECAEANQCIK